MHPKLKALQAKGWTITGDTDQPSPKWSICIAKRAHQGGTIELEAEGPSLDSAADTLTRLCDGLKIEPA